MRDPGLYRLTFLLPEVLRLSVPLGRHHPCLHGCVLVVTSDFLVTIEGPSRESVFEQLRRFMRLHAKGHGAMQRSFVLATPTGRDSWTVIINSGISIVPGARGAELDPVEPVQAEPVPLATATAC